MNLYKHHTPREIIAVLEQSGKLTYEAKRDLLNEIKNRQIDISTERLEEQIAEKEKSIHNLDHLKDLGFVLHQEDKGAVITLRRASAAKFMDVAAIIVGAILFLVGLVHFWLLFSIFFGENEFSLDKLFLYVVLITAGMIGFKMLSGLNRFLDYYKFLLVQTGEVMTITKGGIKGEQTLSVDELKLEEEEEGELILSAGGIEIMRSAQDNLVQKLTLESLLLKMKNNR